MKHACRAILSVPLALSLTGGPAVGQQQGLPTIKGFVGDEVSVRTSPTGSTKRVPSKTIRLPAKIVSVDGSKIAQIIDRDGHFWWIPLRQLDADDGKAGKGRPCTGSGSLGIRGIAC